MGFCGGRWFARDLNKDTDETSAVFHGHFVGETPGRILQKGVGKLEGTHCDVTLTVTRSDAPYDPGIAIYAVIAHQTTGGQWCQSQVILRGTLARVGVVLADKLFQNARSPAQGIGFHTGDRPPHANGESWARGGLPVDHFLREAEIRGQLSNFKFEQTGQWFNHRDVESRWQATDIVVGF